MAMSTTSCVMKCEISRFLYSLKEIPGHVAHQPFSIGVSIVIIFVTIVDNKKIHLVFTDMSKNN